MQLDHGQYNALKTQVVLTLTLAENMGLAGQKANLEDPQVIEMYAVILAENGITADVLAEAGKSLFSVEEFFPRPAALVKHSLPIKERLMAEAKAAYYAKLVECVDEEGKPTAALPDRVRDGVLLPPGDHSGNGRPAPELPARALDRNDPRVNALLSGGAAPMVPTIRQALPVRPAEALTPEEEAERVRAAKERFLGTSTLGRQGG